MKTNPCKGKNCGCTDGVSHSKECIAEHDEATRLPPDEIPCEHCGGEVTESIEYNDRPGTKHVKFRCGTRRTGNFVSWDRTELCRERKARQKAEAERDEARKDLIKNLQTTGGMPWREWRQQCVEEALRADENLARAHKAESEVERWRKQCMAACLLVAKMHEAAVGEIRGPIIEVVEDVKNVRERAEKAEAKIKELKEAAERIGCNRYHQVNRAQSAAAAAIKVAEELAEFTRHSHLDAYEPCPATWDEDKGKWINCRCGLSKLLSKLESTRKSLRDL